MRGTGLGKLSGTVYVRPQHWSWHICEHLNKWQLKRNSRAFHMATQPWAGSQAWIKQATSRAGSGGGLSIPGQQSQSDYRKGLLKGFHSQLCPQFPWPGNLS